MRKCLQGPERDIKHGASENPLSTAHVPPLRKVGAAQFTKINTTGGSERCGVSTYCVPPPVAHGRISMQGADIWCRDHSRASDRAWFSGTLVTGWRVDCKYLQARCSICDESSAPVLKMEDIFFLIRRRYVIGAPATCGSVHSPDSITMASGAVGRQGVIPAPHINTSTTGSLRATTLVLIGRGALAVIWT